MKVKWLPKTTNINEYHFGVVVQFIEDKNSIFNAAAVIHTNSKLISLPIEILEVIDDAPVP